MCVIITTLKKEDDNSANKAIAHAIIEESRINNDGAGIVARNYDGSQFKHIRKMKVSEAEIEALLNEHDMVSVHLRYGTIGKRDEMNCHFWKFGDWYCAHNGTVRAFAQDREQEFADSFLFFSEMYSEGMLKKDGKIKRGDINDITQDAGYWGRMVMLNQEKHRLHFWGDFKTYWVNQACLVVSTATLDFANQNYVSFFGIKIKESQTFEVLRDEFEGHLALNLKKGTSDMSELPEKRTISQTDIRHWENDNDDDDVRCIRESMNEPSADDMPEAVCRHEKLIAIVGKENLKRCADCFEFIDVSPQEIKYVRHEDIPPFAGHPLEKTYQKAMKLKEA